MVDFNFQWRTHFAEWPTVSAAESVIGGQLKAEIEDFRVIEIPAYLPQGEGEHLFLWVEKRDVSAEQLVLALSRALEIRQGDIGVAGLKDRRAITQQFVSVPAATEPRIGTVELEQISVLSAKRHPHKLRTGHLKGNRFDILVREPMSDSLQMAEPISQAICRYGVPNYFGTQRFGFEAGNLQLGFRLLKGEATAQDIPAKRRRFLLRLALSAAQSFLFNESLAQRMQDGLLDNVLVGDVMQVSETGGQFQTTDRVVDQARHDAQEINICGPIFGPKMTRAAGVPAERESDLLERSELCEEDFQRYKRLTSGSRRPLTVRPANLEVRPDPNGLRFQFDLPRGAYATTVMREYLGHEVA
jgi:tRNA pseudouridine13 synthase